MKWKGTITIEFDPTEWRGVDQGDEKTALDLLRRMFIVADADLPDEKDIKIKVEPLPESK